MPIERQFRFKQFYYYFTLTLFLFQKEIIEVIRLSNLFLLSNVIIDSCINTFIYRISHFLSVKFPSLLKVLESKILYFLSSILIL